MHATALFTNASASLIDMGEGVACLEFHSKGNTLDAGTLEAAEFAFASLPGTFAGLVIGNNGTHFSFGANLQSLLSLLDEIGGDRERFHAVAKRFQRVTTGMRTVPFPTVSAPFGLTIGGALELTMYCDAVQAHTSMRANLPEIAVGILPDLGGTSELYARCLDDFGAGNEFEALRDAFRIITRMLGSTDAASARPLHFLRAGDRISDDRELLLDDAKARVLELAKNYQAPTHRRQILVLGDDAYAALDEEIGAAIRAGAASEYDATIARAIARIMTGGPGSRRTVVHEELLDLETQYFESLVFDPRTHARMEYMLAHGTPLRN